MIKDKISPELVELVTSERTELLETLAEVDDQFGEIVLNDEVPITQQIVDTIRRGKAREVGDGGISSGR